MSNLYLLLVTKFRPAPKIYRGVYATGIDTRRLKNAAYALVIMKNRCRRKKLDCTRHECSNHGSCLRKPFSPLIECLCDRGWHGERCYEMTRSEKGFHAYSRMLYKSSTKLFLSFV